MPLRDQIKLPVNWNYYKELTNYTTIRHGKIIQVKMLTGRGDLSINVLLITTKTINMQTTVSDTNLKRISFCSFFKLANLISR